MTLVPLQDGWAASALRGAWHAGEKTWVISDLHLGFARAMQRRGQFMPEENPMELRHRFAELKKAAPARVVVAGDLFHESSPDRETALEARSLLAGLTCDVVVIPGNHDPSLQAMAGIMNDAARVAASIEVAGWMIVHGHDLAVVRERGTLFDSTGAGSAARGVIVGHQHPAVVLATRSERAKMLCFASVSVETGQLPMVVLPAFSHAALGSNLLTSAHWIIDRPMPATASVRILGIVAGGVLDFGPLAGLASLGAAP